MEHIFNEQLINCGVDFFDYYLLHNMGSNVYEKCIKYGAFDFVQKKKVEGKIKVVEGFCEAFMKTILDNAAIAFLGGVDSTFLVRVAHEVLGNKLVAVTATTSTYPERELKEANLTKADIRVLSEEEKTV